MHFKEDCTYHIYNRSNELIFYNRENYLFFLRKIRNHIPAYADIIAYCLMPNHFHLILKVNGVGVQFSEKKKREDMQLISQVLGTILSSYTQALNKQIGRKGNLFAHKTKSKILNDSKGDYALNCFMYVHQNPLMAKLVDKIEDWEFSSYPDYIGQRNGTLVNKQLGLDMFHLNPKELYEITNFQIQDKLEENYI